MSWRIFIPNASVGEAHAKLLESGAPDGIRQYAVAAISALVRRDGDGVRVSVRGDGHLFDGTEGSYDVTSARLEVRRAEAIEAESRKPALKKDGPTVAEWVAKGYRAEKYPPSDYESRSTPDEVAAAVLAEQQADAAKAAADKAQADDEAKVQAEADAKAKAEADAAAAGTS